MNRYIAGLIATVAALALITPASAQKSSEADTLLAAAQQKETLEGDPSAAIKQYSAIVAKYAKTDRAVTAMALVHMAECYQKIGDAQAQRIYEQVVRDYADQNDAVVLARTALGSRRNASSGAVAKRLVCEDCGDNDEQFSPDGRLMVFTDWDSGDIAIRDMSTGKVRRLLAKAGTFRDSDTEGETPRLSPDLRQVVYLWRTGGKKEDHSELRVIQNEPGAKPRVLIDNPAIDYYEPHGWFPDNRSLLVWLAKTDKTWQLARVSVSDGSVKVLKSHCCTGSTLSISPDGKYIVYSARVVNPDKQIRLVPADEKDEHIYILASDGSSETEIVRTAGVNTNCVWAPDGKHILFSSDRSGHVDLWSIAVENGKAVGAESLVSAGIGDIGTFGMHGGSYYYHPYNGAPINYVSIAEMKPAGEKTQDAERTAESFVGQSPSWSPDGKSIALKRPHPGASYYDLVVHSLETGAEKAYPTTLGTTGGGSFSLWFHDGNSVATRIGNAFYRIDLKTGDFKELPIGLGLRGIAPDDKTVYVVNPSTQQVVSVDPDTGQKRQSFTLPLPAGTKNVFLSFDHLTMSPDGRTLAFWVEDPKDPNQIRIACVDVDGSNYHEVFATQAAYFPDFSSLYLAWTKDSRGILFELRKVKGDPFQIMRVSSEGGTPDFTGFEVTDSILSFGLSPDGSRIAFSSYHKLPHDVWALDNILSALK